MGTPKPFLYSSVLGDEWLQLPEQIRRMHEVAQDMHAEGMATVERGTSLLSKLAAGFVGFPPSAQNIPVRVDFHAHGGKETWRRTFGQKSFSSLQYAGRTPSPGLLYERFGPFAFCLALVIEQDRLRLVIQHWSFLGLPMPSFMKPRNNSYEYVENDLFHFHVEIGHWLTGPIVKYQGYLKPSI